MIGNVPSLAPVGIPKGVDPLTWRQTVNAGANMRHWPEQKCTRRLC